MSQGIQKSIAIENLLIDLTNPRYEPQSNQIQAIAQIARDKSEKLVSLAEDIAERGLNPSELLIVVSSSKKGLFTILEGNRRLAAIKLVLSPEMLSSVGLTKKIEEKYKLINKKYFSTMVRQINCLVFGTKEEARHWIELKHTGENNGVGVVQWDGISSYRFRGSSAALQVIDLVAKSNFISEETKEKLPKISITNIERILGTKEARRLLGVDVQKQKLTFLGTVEEVIQKLSLVVSDIANKDIKVTNLDSKDQRIQYAQS